MNPNAYLVLEDKTVWPGRQFGAPSPKADALKAAGERFDGEVIFNTGMTGYHEILSDPSYTGQIVMMTYPHIGNYGVSEDWSEISLENGRGATSRIKAQGLVVRSVYNGPVPNGRESLTAFLEREGVCGITEVDTRSLTMKFRQEGSCNGIIVSPSGTGSLTDSDLKSIFAYLESLPSMQGRSLLSDVGTLESYVENPNGSPHIALLDCGVKKNIIRELKKRNCRITVFPSEAGSSDILSCRPDALLISNGPGDPEPLGGPVGLARELMGKLPLWGICLGHQLLARAAGASTYKMTFGHHGINHPVRDEKTGRVFVTSQNHGFAVDEKSLPLGFSVRFRNANDSSIEGLENSALKLFCVQHHPEASPGPVDSQWIFDAFLETLER